MMIHAWLEDYLYRCAERPVACGHDLHVVLIGHGTVAVAAYGYNRYAGFCYRDEIVDGIAVKCICVLLADAPFGEHIVP